MDLSSLLSSSIVSSLVKETGVEKKNVSLIIKKALPVLQDALDDKTAKAGLAALAAKSLLKDDKKKFDGMEIINTILGSKTKSNSLISSISKSLKGVDIKDITNVLEKFAPKLFDKASDLLKGDKDALKDTAVDLIGGLLKNKK